jgi:hypothetical protein
MMGKISALYDDEEALSTVQKAAQRAQMRKRAQASAVTGTDCEAILHKLPMKKHGIIGEGKDRVFKLHGCVLKYHTVRSHKLKGVIMLMANAELEENINSAGDLMSFSLVVPDASGKLKLVVQRSVFSYDEKDRSDGAAAGGRPLSPRLFEPGFIDPLSKFVQCLRNSIALLQQPPDMQGVLRKLPMSGRPTKSGEIPRCVCRPPCDDVCSVGQQRVLACAQSVHPSIHPSAAACPLTLTLTASIHMSGRSTRTNAAAGNNDTDNTTTKTHHANKGTSRSSRTCCGTGRAGAPGSSGTSSILSRAASRSRRTACCTPCTAASAS